MLAQLVPCAMLAQFVRLGLRPATRPAMSESMHARDSVCLHVVQTKKENETNEGNKTEEENNRDLKVTVSIGRNTHHQKK